MPVSAARLRLKSDTREATMKSTAWMMMTAMTATAMFGKPVAFRADRTVVICTESASDTTGQTFEARGYASAMFNSIGVKLAWHIGMKNCPEHSLMMSFSDHTPVDLRPGAFAYALPYDGTHIRVFYDRVAQIGQTSSRDLMVRVLAHVYVHEITHILEGVARHSETGVMKANWTKNEYMDMMHKPLPFTEFDVILINQGLAHRTSAMAEAAAALQ
jgi:hypothetical protein